MDDSLQAELRRFLADNQQRNAALLSSGYQGSVYLYDENDYKLVIKQAGGGLLTGWLHRLMLRREARVYALLADVEGVPHSPGLLDDTYLVLEFVEGRSLKAERRDLQNREAFYAALRTIIAACHSAGVAHGDLKRKDNIIVDSNEQPHVIDFGTAVMRDGSLFDRMMYPLVVRLDFNAWIKVKYDNDYDAISTEDRQWYQPTVVESVFRLLRRFWRTVTFRQARKRHRRRKASGN